MSGSRNQLIESTTRRWPVNKSRMSQRAGKRENRPINEWAYARANQPMAKQAGQYRRPNTRRPWVGKSQKRNPSGHISFFPTCYWELEFERRRYFCENKRISRYRRCLVHPHFPYLTNQSSTSPMYPSVGQFAYRRRTIPRSNQRADQRITQRIKQWCDKGIVRRMGEGLINRRIGKIPNGPSSNRE